MMSHAAASRVASLRSFLFAPASRRDLAERALRSRADAAIIDLEDAVAEAEKAEARQVAASLLAQTGSASGDEPAQPKRLLRVNAVTTRFFDQDVELLSRVAVDAVVLPKASATALKLLPDPFPPVYALVESAVGLREAFALAHSPKVVGLMLGAVDLAADLGLGFREDGAELLFARSQLVRDSVAAGALPPIDGVWTRLRDSAGLAREAALAYALGMRGKLCIHPAQLPAVDSAFLPGERDRDWARRALAAYEAARSRGDGAVALDGELVDVAVAERARRVLADSLGGASARPVAGALSAPTGAEDGDR